jgi:hypothetical protein
MGLGRKSSSLDLARTFNLIDLGLFSGRKRPCFSWNDGPICNKLRNEYHPHPTCMDDIRERERERFAELCTLT